MHDGVVARAIDLPIAQSREGRIRKSRHEAEGMSAQETLARRSGIVAGRLEPQAVSGSPLLVHEVERLRQKKTR